MLRTDRFSSAADCLLCQIELFQRDNRLMGIFPKIPLFLWNAPLVPIPDMPAFPCMIYHRSGVFQVLNDVQNHVMRPLGCFAVCPTANGFVLGWSCDALTVQFLCNLAGRLPGNHIQKKYGGQ